MENQHFVKVRNVTKQYSMAEGQTLVALDDVNLTIARGEFAGVVGPSGSGKTTLLNLIGSLDQPSTGSIKVMGQHLESLNAKASAEFRNKHVGFIFQTYNLLTIYSVFENVELPLLLLGYSAAQRREAVMEALEWVGLADRAKSKPGQLSGGQNQRVAIARAIIKKPQLVLADEPTANLDTKNSNHILDIMAKINRELGVTFLFSTHDDKVISYLRRKITLHDGRVTTDEVIDAHH
ncbi:MAG: ABC transporter ATP-binding protein [Calditrichaeota bacterium]|nr:MAG: ABC transporter ATP-binding protein [Calditrichota bacterium]